MQGSESYQTDLTAAEQCARRFSQFEDKEPALVLEQGMEPAEFRKAFKLPMQRPPLVPNVCPHPERSVMSLSLEA